MAGSKIVLNYAYQVLICNRSDAVPKIRGRDFLPCEDFLPSLHAIFKWQSVG